MRSASRRLVSFAATQAAYEAAVADVFETLDWLEQRIETRRFLVGERLYALQVRTAYDPWKGLKLALLARAPKASIERRGADGVDHRQPHSALDA